MKRVFCIIISAIMLISVLAGCQPEKEIAYTAEDGKTAEVSQSELKDVECIGSFNGTEAFTISGDKAWELLDYLETTISEAEEKYDTATSERLIHMQFKAKKNGSDVELGVFQVYDSGAVIHTFTAENSKIAMYACDKEVYDKVAEMIKG